MLPLDDPFLDPTPSRSAPRTPWFALATAVASLLLVNGVAVSAHAQGMDGAPSFEPVSRVVPAPVPPVVLLDKQSTTVLGQPLVYPTTGDAQVSSSVITLRPGQRTGSHRHDAPLYAYVLSGAVTVTYESGQIRTYSKGDALMEAVGTVHEGVNRGHVDCRLLVVSIGAEGTANTVRL